jgi:hypothetical protein
MTRLPGSSATENQFQLVLSSPKVAFSSVLFQPVLVCDGRIITHPAQMYIYVEPSFLNAS